MVKVEIDEGSGFCFGVVTAIHKAEEELAKGVTLYCLGDIVHNSREVERLKEMGLITINHEEFKQLHNAKVLLRAHGEPPETYIIAKENNIEIIDATCPVVLRLQKRIKQEYMQEDLDEKQIVIYGKNGHAEVLGLVGQTTGKAIVIEKLDEARRLDFSKSIRLYSQTTKSLDEFWEIVEYIKEHISPDVTFEYYDTICRQVAYRMPNLRKFAASHDLIFFVSGKKSSNGKMLKNMIVMGTVKCVGILTSGGDAPGMNAAIRAVTRAAIYNGLQVKGIYRGYRGLVTGEIKEFKSQNVSNIIQLGGTILKTARCKEFTTPEGRKMAYDNMVKEGIDALVVIGGDGSLTGARIFAQEYDIPCIGLPGTIDNDLYGTDTTIGYDTALNTILDAVDKIRDTATSHERLFFVEVMGRDAGFLALNGAIASGAEAAIIPESSTEVDQLEEFIKSGFRKSKNSSIVLVAESELTGGAMHYAERVKNEYPQYDVRVTILGHLQRGGSPTAHDRILASRLGAAAIDAIMEDQRNVMIGIEHDEIVYVPFSKAIKNDKPVKRDLVNVLRELSI